jgi:soluble lytic murein transglycosylase
MEREFLAAGLPDMAEEAAEVAGRVSPLLSAFAAWERREFRRAVILLKRRFPELGTQNEAAVPLSIRRLYYPSVHTALIETAATEKNIPLPLVLGLIRQESIFESDARSWAGAIGLMQVMPATGKHLYRTEHRRGKPDLLDPAVNVHLGTRYIADMLRIFQGDVVAALAAYNAGPGRVARWKREMAHLEMDEFVESMPLSEPRDYVKKVLFFKAAYSALYGLPSPVQVDQNGTRRLQIRFASSF